MTRIKEIPPPPTGTDALVTTAKVVGELMGMRPQVAAHIAKKCAETVQKTVAKAANKGKGSDDRRKEIDSSANANRKLLAANGQPARANNIATSLGSISLVDKTRVQPPDPIVLRERAQNKAVYRRALMEGTKEGEKNPLQQEAVKISRTDRYRKEITSPAGSNTSETTPAAKTAGSDRYRKEVKAAPGSTPPETTQASKTAGSDRYQKEVKAAPGSTPPETTQASKTAGSDRYQKEVKAAPGSTPPETTQASKTVGFNRYGKELPASVPSYNNPVRTAVALNTYKQENIPAPGSIPSSINPSLRAVAFNTYKQENISAPGSIPSSINPSLRAVAFNTYKQENIPAPGSIPSSINPSLRAVAFNTYKQENIPAPGSIPSSINPSLRAVAFNTYKQENIPAPGSIPSSINPSLRAVAFNTYKQENIPAPGSILSSLTPISNIVSAFTDIPQGQSTTDNPASGTSVPMPDSKTLTANIDRGAQGQSTVANPDDASKAQANTQTRTEVAAVEGKLNNGTTGTYTIAERPQVGGKPVQQYVDPDLYAAIDRRFAERTGIEPKDHSVSSMEVGRPGAVIVTDAGAAPGTTGRPGDVIAPGSGVLKDVTPLTMSRESVAVTPGQMLTANQMSNALYMNDTVAKGVNGQNTLTVRESNSVGYTVNPMLSRESQNAGLAGVGTIGQGILQSGDVRGTGIAGESGRMQSIIASETVKGAQNMGSASLAPTDAKGMLQVADGTAIKGIVSIAGIDGRMGTIPTETTGKKGGNAIGEITTTVSGIINTTVVKDGKIIDGLEETKLAAGKTPGTQSPLAGIPGAPTTTTTTTTQTTGSKDPNTQNTTTTQDTTTTTKDGKDVDDWADTLPELDIVDSRKEVVVDMDDDDYDHQDDQFVANDGRRGGGAYTPHGKGVDTVRGLVEIIVADNAGKKLDDTKGRTIV